MFLQARRGISQTCSKNSAVNTVDSVLQDVSEHFRVDLAGHYDFDQEIHAAIHDFIADLPIDAAGYLRAGEYRLPDGRLMLVISDVQLCLMADRGDESL
jgi:hypothetical protein